MKTSRSNSVIRWSKRDHRVYLIEDDDELRLQLALVLRDVDLVVEEFASAEAFLAHSLDSCPSVVLSDMVLPGLSGIDLLKAIRQAGVISPVVYISGYSEPHQIIAGMKLGAVDFLWKPFKADALRDVVCKALVGELEQEGLMARWDSLTEREQEVCRLMLQGIGNKEVAERLEIQPDTANKHRMKVLKKLAVDGRPQLIELLKNFSPAHT